MYRALCLFFLSLPTIGLADTPTLFEMATSRSAQSNLLAGTVPAAPYRWREDSITIGLFVEESIREAFLPLLAETFEPDRRILQSETSIRLPIGLWGDEGPEPRIFVLIGTRDQLIGRAHTIARRFDLDTFPAEMADMHASGVPLCNSVISVGQDQTILRAIITVDADAQPFYCLRRQLILAFGLFGDLPAGTPSILASDQGETTFTELDRRLLRTLYSEN